MKVRLDLEKCVGHGRCYVLAPEVFGEDDLPIPNVRYEIELPDGRVKRGTLDGDGTARVDGIPTGGTCQVRFPTLDEEAWTPR